MVCTSLPTRTSTSSTRYLFGVHIGVTQQCQGGGLSVGSTRPHGRDRVVRGYDVSHARQGEDRIAVGNQQHTLAEVAKLIPKGVVCLTSALAFHGLTDQLLDLFDEVEVHQQREDSVIFPLLLEGGAAAAMGNVNAKDNWQVHFRDTMRGGKFLNQWRMAELHAKEAPERVRELEDWGAVFDRTKTGLIHQRNFGGHRYPRLAHTGDRTGLELIRTLQDAGVHRGINVHMECTVLDLLKDGDRVIGALGYWRDTGRFVLFKAKSVVLASGGVGKAWRVTSNSWEYTGDGLAMAYLAGAELMDLEFTQFHPTGMVWPPSVRGTLVTEGVRGDGGILKNKEGKRFMFGYIPERFAPETADSEDAETDRSAKAAAPLIQCHACSRNQRCRAVREAASRLSQSITCRGVGRCAELAASLSRRCPVPAVSRRATTQGQDGNSVCDRKDWGISPSEKRASTACLPVAR